MSQPYPSYKKSGSPWAGSIPAHWSMVPIKHIAEISSGSTPSKSNPDYWDGEIPWASARDLRQPVLMDTTYSITTAALQDGAAAVVPTGSVIVLVRGMTLAHSFPVCVTGKPMAVNQDLKALIARETIEGSYLAWLLRGSSVESLSWVDAAGHGTKVLRMDVWTTIALPIPPVSEQRAIAAFLDRETGKIDALVEEQRRLIALLKEKRQAVISHAVTKGLDPTAPLKPSGIDWLGDIPAHWECVPTGYRYDVQLGRMLNEERARGENMRPYLRVFDVQWGHINTQDLPLMDFPSEIQERYKLQAGDLMVNEGGSYVGRSAIWHGEIDECYYQKALHRLRPQDKAADTAEFFLFVMEMATARGIFIHGGNQTTIDHLTAEQLRRHRFAFPPLDEQEQIAEHLKRETAKLEALASEAETAIDLLQERRSALISAAVTGKIDVRDLVPNATEAA